MGCANTSSRFDRSPSDPPSPGLLRRFAAIFYDSLLLLSVLFFASVPVLVLTRGEAVPPGHPLYTAYLVALSFIYFSWFWTHGGQTPGMRAWKIQLRSQNGGPVTWRQTSIRFLCAVPSWVFLGAGFFWALVDRNQLTWHDRLSRTMLTIRPR